MKLTKSILLMAVMLTSGTAVAYSPEELQKECHKPKFTDFTLKEYKATEPNEVAPETEFSLKVPAWTNPESIKLSLKKQPLAFTLESNSTFHKIKAKIPAEYAGKFVRLDISAKVTEGECHDTTGWLLKIADNAPATTEAAAAEEAPTEQPAAPATPITSETTPAAPATVEATPATPSTEAAPAN